MSGTMKRVLLAGVAAVALVVMAAGAASADAFYDALKPVFDAEGGGIYYVHGREATGIGPGLDWQLIEGFEPLRLTLIAAHSSLGHDRVIPGVGLQLDADIDLTIGVAWPPSEYGQARIGPITTYAAPYIGLSMTF